MKKIEDTSGIERVVTTLLGKAAETVSSALTNKMLGHKKAKRSTKTKRKPVLTKPGKSATVAEKEVRHA